MAGERRGEYASLFTDVNVKRWYDNVARGSFVTADVYLRRLGSFCNHFNRSPKDLLTMSEDSLFNLLLDYVTSMEQKGYAGSYIHSTIKAVKSWLSHYGIEIKRKIKIRGAQETPSLKDERVPTKDELRKIFLSGDKKARVASVFVAHSGLRIESLGDYRGNDGLKVSDLPELKVGNDIVEFEQIPTKVIVREPLSKAGHEYFSFLSEEGCEYLRDYLEERIREGEEIGPDTSVITSKIRLKAFIRSTNIGDLIRTPIRKTGFRWRPYVLRSYFDTQVMLAESKGLVIRDYRVFWMGHKGDIEAIYTTNKHKLPDSVVESMRDSYRKSEEFLQTTKAEVSEEKLKTAFREQLLLAVGLSQEEVDTIDLLSLSDEDLQAMLRKKLLGEKTNDCTTQKVVVVDEVERYLNDGWEFVATLPNSNVILRLSTT